MSTISVSEIRNIKPVGLKGMKRSQKEKDRQLTGVIEIAGVEHFATLLKCDKTNDDYAHYLPVDFKKEPAGNLEIEDTARFRTIRVPNYEGEYLLFVTPQGRTK